MKLNWNEYFGKILNITMHENYGVKDIVSDSPFYEIVFKTGKLTNAFDEGLLLETVREQNTIKIFVPFTSIKCVEIFEL
ncbi:MAG TPA: hypothetical protein VLN45_00375 [Ignavibacteriaceae bacterium]|nr:hypothetical protein [Ignavibacteriaceae bacterium]